jgi:hypothetical protein
MNPGLSHVDVDGENADRIAFFRAVYEGFSRAANSTGTVDYYFKIADRNICLRFAGTGLVPQLTPALAHLEAEPVSEPALTVCLWDTASTNTRMPLLVSSLINFLRLRWWELLDPRREIKGYNDHRIRSAFHLGPDILSLLDMQQNLALYWVMDAAEIPYYERGYPLQTILNWWAANHGHQYVHAAAVGTEAGGVLIGGKGGCGKSTSALSCIDSDLKFLSDDYSLVALDPFPRVYSLYNTAKLKGIEDIQRFPLLAPMISNADHLDEEKAMIFLHEHLPEKIVSEFPLRAILLPQVAGTTETKLHPAKPVAALRTLAPTTILQLSGTGQEAFRLMSGLVKRVPCYTLELGTEIYRIPEVIINLLNSDSCRLRT